MLASIRLRSCLGIVLFFSGALVCGQSPPEKLTEKSADKSSPEKLAASGVGAALPPYPLDTVVLPDGDAVVVDRNLPGLWRLHAAETSLWLQGSRRFREPLNAPRCLALDKSGQLLVGDSSTREIYRIDQSLKPQPLTGGKIGIPMDIAVRADGTLVVADLETRSLLRVSADGQKVESIAVVNPRGVFVDQQDRVWVVSQDAQQLQIVGDDGKTQAIVDKRTFDFPHQVVVNSAGEAFVSDGYKKAIWKVVNGQAPQVLVSGAPLDNPVGLTLHNDQLVITDPRARQVFRLRDGKVEPWFKIGQ
jgi:DNA-binding beta-propeller fold protein YncE